MGDISRGGRPEDMGDREGGSEVRLGGLAREQACYGEVSVEAPRREF